MTKYRRNDVILQIEPETEDAVEDHGFSITENTILEALERKPWAFIRQIAEMTFIPPPTVFRCLRKYSYSPEAIVLGSPQTLGSSETGSGHHVKGVTEAV
jgi:hypothetical protein